MVLAEKHWIRTDSLKRFFFKKLVKNLLNQLQENRTHFDRLCAPIYHAFRGASVTNISCVDVTAYWCRDEMFWEQCSKARVTRRSVGFSQRDGLVSLWIPSILSYRKGKQKMENLCRTLWIGDKVYLLRYRNWSNAHWGNVLIALLLERIWNLIYSQISAGGGINRNRPVFFTLASKMRLRFFLSHFFINAKTKSTTECGVNIGNVLRASSRAIIEKFHNPVFIKLCQIHCDMIESRQLL